MYILDTFCSDIYPLLRIINYFLSFIQIIGPIVAILALLINSFNIVKANDSNEMNKYKKRMINSVIALVVLFFIPILVNLAIELAGTNTKFTMCYGEIRSIGKSEYIETNKFVDKNNDGKDDNTGKVLQKVYVAPEEYVGKVQENNNTNSSNNNINLEQINNSSGGMRIALLALRYAPTASPEQRISSNGPKTKVNNPRLYDWYEYVDTIGDKVGFPRWYASCTPDVLYIVYGATGLIYNHIPSDEGFAAQFRNDPAHWVEINTYSNQTYDEVCQPGDVLWLKGGGHGALYIGNNVVKTKFPNSDGNVWESGQVSRKYPGITKWGGKAGNYIIFRYIG